MLIYVWNLSPEVSEDHCREIFEAYGRVSFAIISSAPLKDRSSGRSRTLALVEMPDPTEAQEAIHRLNRKDLCGRAIMVYGSCDN